MKIDNGEFYILDLGEVMEICPTLSAAVDCLRASRSEDAEIQKFSRGGGKWLVSPVSWKEVSMQLLAGGVGDKERA